MKIHGYNFMRRQSFGFPLNFNNSLWVCVWMCVCVTHQRVRRQEMWSVTTMIRMFKRFSNIIEKNNITWMEFVSHSYQSIKGMTQFARYFWFSLMFPVNTVTEAFSDTTDRHFIYKTRNPRICFLPSSIHQGDGDRNTTHLHIHYVCQVQIFCVWLFSDFIHQSKSSLDRIL